MIFLWWSSLQNTSNASSFFLGLFLRRNCVVALLGDAATEREGKLEILLANRGDSLQNESFGTT